MDRNYFAAHADITWMKDATPEQVSAKTAIPIPNNFNSLTEFEKAKFYVKAEITWRWRYADLMLSGDEPTEADTDRILKRKKP